MLFLLVACSEYGLNGMEDAQAGLDSGFAPSQVPCEQVDLDWSWQGSELLHSQDQMPVDGFVAIALPDVDTAPAGTDRAYRTDFTLEALPDSLFVDLQSDDGIWLWVNGVEVGHWGGGWQQEGCVNDDAQCVERVQVDPVDIAPWLELGDNRVETRVSNAIMGHYFELIPTCG